MDESAIEKEAYKLAAQTDAQSYRWAALTLKVGMYASLGAMGLGLLWWVLLGAPGGEAAASETIPIEQLPSELFALNPLALMNLGVLLLLATPGVMLLALVITYALARNWRYAAIGAFVGLVLILSVVLSLWWIPRR
jgi:uncharacterized membrane protein